MRNKEAQTLELSAACIDAYVHMCIPFHTYRVVLRFNAEDNTMLHLISLTSLQLIIAREEEMCMYVVYFMMRRTRSL